MAFCPQCGTAIPEGGIVCPACGTVVAVQAAANPVTNQYPTNPGAAQYAASPAPAPAPTYDPYDHTAEFDAKDIADNKLLALVIYGTLVSGVGLLGIIVAMLRKAESPYLAFHVRQGLKYVIVDMILSAAALVLCWTFIVPAAAAICILIMEVLQIISFVQVCKNEAKEPAIIRSLSFLN